MILEALNIMILEVALSTVMLEVALPLACSGNGRRKKKEKKKKNTHQMMSPSGLVVSKTASIATCIVGWMGGANITKSSRKNREAVSEFYGDPVLKLKGLVVEAKNSGVQL